MNAQRGLPSDVDSFISACIDSVEQVEILLLLSATHERAWTIDELSEHLRSSTRSVGLRLASLEWHQLVRRDGSAFRYAASPSDDARVRRLAQLYDERRSAVIDRIFTVPRDPMQFFADAFRLKEENHDG